MTLDFWVPTIVDCSFMLIFSVVYSEPQVISFVYFTILSNLTMVIVVFIIKVIFGVNILTEKNGLVIIKRQVISIC